MVMSLFASPSGRVLSPVYASGAVDLEAYAPQRSQPTPPSGPPALMDVSGGPEAA